MPSFPIVDAHVHLYDPTRLRYGWMAGDAVLDRPHGLAELDRVRGGATIEKLVWVEAAADPGQHLAEAAWAQRLADADARIAGLVAAVPVEKGAAVEADLARLRENRALRGVRRLLQSEVDQSFCLAPAFLDGLRVVARHGLTFDLCLKHWGLVFAIELARRVPELTFVLDHLGKPGIAHGLVEPWKSQLRELAREPNVVCKISGVVTEADHRSWTVERIRPYVDWAIERFGFERVMFGSDWPVSETTHRYPDWIAILDGILAGTSEAERRAFWYRNAIRVYRLD